MNRSAKGLLIVTTNLVWRIADNSPNSPNFLPTQFSCYMVYGIAITMGGRINVWNSSLRNLSGV